MRLLFVLIFAITAACRVPYTSDIADMTVMPYSMPPVGMPEAELNKWFDENGFVATSRVFQTEAELRRKPGAPLIYALPQDRSWWQARVQTVRDLCFTEKFIYFRTDAEGRLSRALGAHRSQCS